MISPARKGGDASFPIVGIGASAGGLEAFSQLLSALPADTGMGFVLVQHLAPTHESMLSNILARATAMRVTEVKDEPRVEPNHVYVIPPDWDMIISGGILHLIPRTNTTRGQHHPIDGFFRALAKDRGRGAIGVILSGTATDGTLGLEEIKGADGITFVQDDTAQHNGMPRSAIAAGCADFVLPPERIAQEIARLARHPYVVSASAAKNKTKATSAAPSEEDQDEGESELSEILQLLRGATNVDFSQYKVNTLKRRVGRRMVLHKLDQTQDYVLFLRDNPGEVEALYQDILINVTSFFRDPDAFEQLKETVFPRLLERASRSEPVRAWVLGCSTGEEAYSVAIAFTEFFQAASREISAQIFATDVNGSVVEKARAGQYSENALQYLSPERRRRFFAKVDGRYAISKSIRDVCVFAQHNALTDPPFSRMNFISCRNVLIYLDATLQRKLMPTLHYALRPEGFLMLGKSETISSYKNLFEAKDQRHKIYVRKPGPGRLPIGLSDGGRPAGRGGPESEQRRPQAAVSDQDIQKAADRVLLAAYAPVGVLINAELEILSFRGDTGPYLTPASGKASLNLLKMAREGLLVALRAAIHKARKTHDPVRESGLRVRSNGDYREITLEVLPVKGNSASAVNFWVLFEAAASADQRKATPAESETPPAIARESDSESAEQQIRRLTQELEATRDYLSSMVEQHEAANEELQSANEEAQSANEELQSLNEELETSKEEIESSNEELVTVNDELSNRNRQLDRLNNDLVNLIDSVQTPIVIVGQDLRIRRFTPAAQTLFNLIPADIGRLLSDMRLDLDIADLNALLTEVIDTVKVTQREIRDRQGRWYSLRLRPYKTLDNTIDGAVLMLLDVDALKRAHEFAESIVATVREPLLVLDGELRVRTASRSFYRDFAVSPEETEGRRLYELGNGQWNIPELLRLLQEILPGETTVEDFQVSHEFKQVGPKTMRLNARRLLRADGEGELILLAIGDVSENARLEENLQERVEELAEADRRKNEFLAMLAHELRNPLAALGSAAQILNRTDVDGAVAARARDRMGRQLQNMARMLDDLLDVSRITRGKIELRKEPVELAAVLTRAADSMRHLVEAGGRELTISLPPESVWLNADANRLEQVFDNLLNNAAKFTHAGGHIQLTAERTDLGEGGVAVIRVRDDGIGIAGEILPSVFNLFTQADASLDRSRGGLGIGLTLARTLTEMHGGKVEAHSAGVGQGSEFIVRLPIFRVSEAEARKQAEASVSAIAASAARRILVVDDNVDAADAMADVLRLEGHAVSTAHDGPGALEAAAGFKPEVVLLDIGLPGMDGFEVARRLRRRHGAAGVLLIALSGYGEEENHRRGREAGFDHYLVKPVDLQVLRALLWQPDTPFGKGGRGDLRS